MIGVSFRIGGVFLNEKEIDLSKSFKLFISHIVPILVAGAVCAALVLCYCSFLMKPVYKTRASVLVNNGSLASTIEGSTIISSANMSASLSLVTTCIDILKSDKVYIELAGALNNKYSYTDLKSMFGIASRNDNSLLIDLSVQGEDPDEIREIANTFLEIIPTYIKITLPPTDVKIMADANRAYETGPKLIPTALISFAVGALLCYLVFLIIGMFRNTIESEADFKARHDVPLLGSVPFFEAKNTGGK